MLINGAGFNAAGFNNAHGPINIGVHWADLLPVERMSVYLLEIGGAIFPMSSAQATMRLSGQSFLQAIVPNGDAYIEALDQVMGEPIRLLSGYRYPDGELSPLEPIAEAPFQLLRRGQGPFRDTLTLSGYGQRQVGPPDIRTLSGFQSRTTETDGRRRVRCEIDIFLRPGHTAIDSDGAEFGVGIIQYFIGPTTEAMEVIQDG